MDDTEYLFDRSTWHPGLSEEQIDDAISRGDL